MYLSELHDIPIVVIVYLTIIVPQVLGNPNVPDTKKHLPTIQ